MPTKTYLTDLSCQNCVNTLAPFLNQDSRILSWSVDLSSSGHPLSVESNQLDESSLQEILKSAGYLLGKDISQASKGVAPDDSEQNSQIQAPANVQTSVSSGILKTLQTYSPLILIFTYLAGASLVYAWQTSAPASEVMNFFMGIFFVVFSFFKLLNCKSFARSFRMYDPIAKLSKSYARAYPLIELSLGLAYLLHFYPRVINAVTAGIMGIGAAGIARSLAKNQEIECACLGTVFQLPMSLISLMENLIMFAMAIFMFFQLAA